MEASAHPQPSPGPLALGGVQAIDLVDDGHGLIRLAVMVGTVFERLTALNDEPAEAESRE